VTILTIPVGTDTFDVMHIAEFVRPGQPLTSVVETFVDVSAGLYQRLVDALSDTVQEHTAWVFEITRCATCTLAYEFHGAWCTQYKL